MQEDESNTDQKITDMQEDQALAFLGFLVDDFHFINTVEKEAFRTTLKTFS